MPSALTVRFRPAGLWRIGPDNGARTRTDRVFHSDSLYSALTLAMRDLGWVDEWIAATAESAAPAVRLSSCFPFSQQGLMIQPPRTVWPPAQSGKVRWKAARFVPVSLVSALLKDEDLKEEQWTVDPVSECLVPVGRHGAAPAPFRVVMRSTAAVDRVSGASESSDPVAALQFAQGAGLWFVAVFADDAAREKWEPRLRSAAILLADTGIGGGRSRGWGKSRRPHFERGEWPAVLGGRAQEQGETAWWLVSLFSPADNEQVDWKRGNYGIVIRAGRVESHAAWGDLKPASRLVAEGSVLLSGAPPSGTARNVAPAELPHPVYRSGIALAVPIPWREAQRFSLMEPKPAATTVGEEPQAGLLEGAAIEAVSPEAEDLSAGAVVSESADTAQVTTPESEAAPVDEVIPAEQVTAPEPQAETPGIEPLTEAAETAQVTTPESAAAPVDEVIPAEQVTAPKPEAETPGTEPLTEAVETAQVTAPESEAAPVDEVIPAEQVTAPEPGTASIEQPAAPVLREQQGAAPESEEMPAEPVNAPEDRTQPESSMDQYLVSSEPSQVPGPSEVPAPQPSQVPEPSPAPVPAPEPSKVPAPPPSQPSKVPAPPPSQPSEPQPSEPRPSEPRPIEPPPPSDVPVPEPSQVPPARPSEIPSPSPSDVPAPQPSEVPMPSQPDSPNPQIGQASSDPEIPAEPAEPPVQEPPTPEQPPVQEPPPDNPDDKEPRI